MEAIIIEGAIRGGIGKRGVKAIRRENLIPCELYGGKENIHFTASKNQVKALIYTPDFYKAEIRIGGRSIEAIVKDIQYHPTTEEILHIDFLELVPGKPVKTDIPVRTIGTAQGVKTGGKLMLKVRKLKVKSIPEQLKDKIEIDVTQLLLGQSFKVKDIPDTGMEILNSKSIPVASIEVPRLLRSATTDEAAPGAAAATPAAAPGAAASAPEAKK